MNLESDLYEPVKMYLEAVGFVVKGEVEDCDIVAVHPDGHFVIIELKQHFNVSLLLQAVDRFQLTDDVYVAVMARAYRGAHRKRWTQVRALCQRLGLGLLTVKGKAANAKVEVWCDPQSSVIQKNKKRQKKLLKEFHDRRNNLNVGGISKRKIITAYREQAIQCAALLHLLGPCKPRTLRDLTGFLETQRLLHRNVYGWFRNVERGIYELTSEGRDALQEYEHVLMEWACPWPQVQKKEGR